MMLLKAFPISKNKDRLFSLSLGPLVFDRQMLPGPTDIVPDLHECTHSDAIQELQEWEWDQEIILCRKSDWTAAR